MSADQPEAAFGWRRAARAGLRFRRATEDDVPFLFRVYASTRADELARLPWPEAGKRAFLDMQARAQHAHHQRHFPDADRLVIEAGGAPAGRLYLQRRAREHGIVDVALLPEHRGRGLGTALLRDLLDEAGARVRAVELHVERLNPARRLYLRLGFTPVEEGEVYDRLRWGPPQANTAS